MYEQHLKQQEHLKDCADYQLHNPWKLKLRRLGKHVRKFMAHLAPGRLRKKRQGYSKFYTEDEERLRFLLFHFVRELLPRVVGAVDRSIAFILYN
uniref:Uncharacterized protein n=1 Tax=Trichogramma kaykai TaxID=54128 RepID=A0ABD2X8U8_9HYME